jgi:predicted ATPase
MRTRRSGRSRAGLALTEVVGNVVAPAGKPLAARVGIATGLVMVGELIGEGAAKEQTVVGETPNLAARLQALAAPGSVVISQTTRRLVGGLFELADLGPVPFKGFAEPLSAFRVAGEGRAEGRFEALHGERLTPLVGREHELGMLLERWAWAKDGDGQVVLLSGEPGIGKSRVIRTLRECLGDEPYTPLSHYCSLYHTNSALYPVIGLLERAAQLDRDEPPEAQLARLEVLLSQSSDRLDEVVPLLAALLRVPTGERYPVLALTPEVQKRRTLQVLVDQIASLAAQQPVLALYEDVHWIDPSTLELLSLVIERIRQLPVLVLITFRPEFQPPWISETHVTTLTMSRLGRRQGTDLVARVAGDKPLPADIVEQIVGRTDGIPLFIEELTKTVLESGLLQDVGDHYELSGPLPPLAIPTTLHDSLLARLDRLASVKEEAQIGATIGREFSYLLLAGVADRPEGQLQSALDQLVRSGLVFRTGVPPEVTYSFKHALVQEAAYGTLLKSRRQQLHSRVARVLTEQFPDRVVAEPELLAHHHTEAGEAEQAIKYWLKAGQRATERSANMEAIAHLRRGLDLLDGVADSLERARRELALQVALGAPLLVVKGYSAPETSTASARAYELCKHVGETTQLYPVLFAQWGFHLVRAEFKHANELAAEFLDKAERQEEAVPLLMGHRVVGTSAFFLGQLMSARAHLEQTLALYDSSQARTLALLYAFNPRVTSLGYLSCVLFALGYSDQAIMRGREALNEAQQLSHPNTTAQALFFGCALNQFLGAGPAVRDRAEELISLSSEQGFPLYLAHGTIFCGWAVAKAGQTAVGSAQLSEGLAAWRTTGAEYILPYFLTLLAEAHSCIDRAEDWLTEALARVERTGERWFEAELHRLKGELLLIGNQAGAEACFQRALTVARAQTVRAWELRAATSLARLWAEHGERQKALDLLAPVYGWFTEGFDTADLKDAKELLDELA